MADFPGSGDIFSGEHIHHFYSYEIHFFEEIIISRKNARMYLTVRGLPALHKAIDYYFTIHLNNNGYNFKGTPIPNAIVIKQNGITLANNDFVSPSSFNLIHTDSSREDYATVNLYRRSDTEYGEDILIASINSDLNGNF